MSAILPSPRGETAFLGLGSNVGDRLAHLQQALRLIDDDARTDVVDVSSVYETAPVGGPAQDPYYNAVARVVTRRSPRALLGVAGAVEQALGRVRTVRWGPRTIDVDVLLYGVRVVTTQRLVVPHPRMMERAFVLVPLLEVAPGWKLPDGGTVSAAVARLAPIEGVHPLGRYLAVPRDEEVVPAAHRDVSSDAPTRRAAT